MKRNISFIFAVFVMLMLSEMAFSQVAIESQPFKGKLKIEPYAEYITFNNDDIDAHSWGGGIMARYLFTDYLGLQSGFTYFGKCSSEHLEGDLSPSVIRLSLILHTYITGMEGEMPLYVYGGAGAGYQFNDLAGTVDLDNAFIGQVLGGIGYDFQDNFFIETEGGYQFGQADAKNYREDNASLGGVFIRLGVGARF